jgi:hypothetical protein
MTRLCEIAEKWHTDKVPSIRHNYTPFYHQLFQGRDIKKVLEIGIGSVPNMNHVKDYIVGASLFMWQEYFPEAQIFGLDIRPESMVNEGRIRSFVCDQSDEASLKSVIPQLGGGFDIILDDGSHLPEDQILTAELFVPLLRPGGVYIIEDVHKPHISLAKLPYPYYWVDFTKSKHLQSPWWPENECYEFQVDDQLIVLQLD